MSYVIPYSCTIFWKATSFSFGLFYLLMTLALLPLCRLHTSCISISSDPSRWSLTALHLAHWGCSLYRTTQNTCSLGKGHMATSTHYIPSIQSSLSGAAANPCDWWQTTHFGKIPWSVGTKAEQGRRGGGVLSKKHKVNLGALNTLLKILRKRKKLKILIWVHCFSKQQGQTSSKFMGFIFEWKSQHFLSMMHWDHSNTLVIHTNGDWSNSKSRENGIPSFWK